MAYDSAETVAGEAKWPLSGGTFLSLLWTIVVAAYLSAFAIARAPFFENEVGDYWGTILDYAFSANNVDADVVVFGDSTALFDFDPLRAGSALGVKIVNLPNTYGSLPVTGDDALQKYLRHNKQPRLIVFYLSAWNLNYSHQPPNANVFEGEEMLVRNGTSSQLAAYFGEQPVRLLEFPFQFYETAPSSALHSIMLRRGGRDAVAAAHGHVDHGASEPLHTGCTLPSSMVSRSGDASARELIAKYRNGDTHTALYLAPMPACAGSSMVTERSYLGGTTAPPITLPPALFVADGFYAHLLPEGVSRSTDSLVKALSPMLATSESVH